MKTAAFRLGFIAASTAFVVALIVLAGWLGWWTTLLAGIVGVLLAIVLREDYQPPVRKPEPRPRTRRERGLLPREEPWPDEENVRSWGMGE